MNRYFLMRHGQSEANVAGRIISSPETGIPGFGLSEAGREQATRWATACGLGPDTLIVASDFRRARETAELAARALRAGPVRLDKSLRERFFGTLEGGPDSRYDQVWALDDQDPEHEQWGVESASHVAARLASVLTRLDAEVRERTVLLVSHGDPLRFLQLRVAARPLTEHRRIRFFDPAEIRAWQDLPNA